MSPMLFVHPHRMAPTIPHYLVVVVADLVKALSSFLEQAVALPRAEPLSLLGSNSSQNRFFPPLALLFARDGSTRDQPSERDDAWMWASERGESPESDSPGRARKMVDDAVRSEELIVTVLNRF